MINYHLRVLLHVLNTVNLPIKRQRLSDYTNRDQSTCSQQIKQTTNIKKHIQMRIQGEQYDYIAICNKDIFIILKLLIPQEDTKKTHFQQILYKAKIARTSGEVDILTNIVCNFNAPLSVTDNRRGKNIFQSNTVSQLYSRTVEKKLCSSVHRAFIKIMTDPGQQKYSIHLKGE